MSKVGAYTFMKSIFSIKDLNINQNKFIRRIFIILAIILLSFLATSYFSKAYANITCYETVINNELLFHLPTSIEISNVSKGDENSYLYDINLSGKYSDIKGFIKVIECNEPIEIYTHNYKLENDLSNYMNLKESYMNEGHMYSIIWEFNSLDAETQEGFTNKQNFIEQDNYIYLINISAPDECWEGNNCNEVFDTISSSIKLVTINLAS